MFTRNRDRLLTADMPRKMMAALLAHRKVAPLLSDDHYSVDGTLIKSLGVDEEFPAEGAAFSNRRAHNPAQGLRPVPEAPQADRGGVDWAKTVGGMSRTVYRGV